MIIHGPGKRIDLNGIRCLEVVLIFHIINKYLVVTIINILSMIEGKCKVELSSDKVPEVFDVFWQIYIFIIVEDFFLLVTQTLAS
jgi:hypothetical protein